MTTPPCHPDRPSAVRVLVGYPNADPADPAGTDADDYPPSHRLSIRQMLGRKTVKMTHPEVVRRHVAMFTAYAVETGGIAGFGTFWRPGAEQLRNHERNPRQFSHPDTSYHVEVQPWGLAVACDTVPAAFWPWMHRNASRFGLVHLTRNEQHHTSPEELPKSRRTYNADPAGFVKALDGRPLDLPYLPYLGRATVADWLADDWAFGDEAPDGEPSPPVTNPAPSPKPAPKPSPAPKPTEPPMTRITMQYRPPHLTPDRRTGGDDYNRAVRNAQSLLNGLMLGTDDPLVVDGDYGPKTQAAVRQWQKYHGLTVDGYVGQRTWPTLLGDDATT